MFPSFKHQRELSYTSVLWLQFLWCSCWYDGLTHCRTLTKPRGTFSTPNRPRVTSCRQTDKKKQQVKYFHFSSMVKNRKTNDPLFTCTFIQGRQIIRVNNKNDKNKTHFYKSFQLVHSNSSRFQDPASVYIPDVGSK